MADETLHCGFVALAGRPNVGKSSILNRLIGEKVSIVSRKPQTTRHQVLGIHQLPDAQIVYVDTPGLHGDARRAMNRYMNRTATTVLADVDVVVFVVEALQWTEDDELVLERIRSSGTPAIAAVNKVDRVEDKALLLPYLQELSQRHEFAEIVPVSARKGTGLDALEQLLKDGLPLSEPYYPREQLTDRGERFRAAELVREQLMRHLGQELPYATTVEIEQFQRDGALLRIAAVIWVERPGQKAIVIGRQGSLLKRIGQEARREMERVFQSKVFLQSWVKVREGWSDDERALRSLGYE